MANSSCQSLSQSFAAILYTNMQQQLYTLLTEQLLLLHTYMQFVLLLLNAALLSQVASKDEDELQISTISEVKLSDERPLSLNTAVPTNTVDTCQRHTAVTVAFLYAYTADLVA